MTKEILQAIVVAMGLVFAVAGCSTKAETVETENKTMNTEGTQIATVTIDGGKYTPNVVTVDRGKPVELTFIGGSELGCGGTVVFKSLNMTKDVESGKTVAFIFTPQEAGEIPFTCGMGMYDGKVVVK